MADGNSASKQGPEDQMVGGYQEESREEKVCASSEGSPLCDCKEGFHDGEGLPWGCKTHSPLLVSPQFLQPSLLSLILPPTLTEQLLPTEDES